MTDTYNLTFVVFRYRNNLYLKDIEVDMKLTGYQLLLAKQIYMLSYIDIFYKRRTTFHNWNNLCQERMHSFFWAFSDCTRN